MKFMNRDEVFESVANAPTWAIRAIEILNDWTESGQIAPTREALREAARDALGHVPAISATARRLHAEWMADVMVDVIAGSGYADLKEACTLFMS